MLTSTDCVEGLKEFTPQTPFDNFNFHKVDSITWEKIKQALIQSDWSPATTATDQDTAWKAFRTIVSDTCAEFVPLHTTSRKKRMAKIPKFRRKLLIKKRALMKRIKYSKLKTPDNSEKIQELYTGLSRIELLMATNIAEQNYREENEVLRKIKTNPKAFFSFANRHKTAKSGIGPLKDGEGVLHSDPATMANLLADQYQKVFSTPIHGEIPDNQTATNKPVLDTISITATLVSKAIDELAAHTAPGPDKFPAILLKKCSAVLAPVMAELWQSSMSTGDVAKVFKQQSIVPIFKKGNRSSPANYRPVSLTSQIVKVFERVVRRQMADFVESNNLLSPDQHGFRSKRSCLSHLLHHIEDVLKDLETGANADVLYLDYSKAFDKVCHHTLLRKLSEYGIRGNLLRWIKCFLTDRSQKVIVDGVASKPGSVRSGVPQGTVLGPLLFVLYINDLPERTPNTRCKMFADDTKLQKTVRNEEDRTLMMQDLESVVNWATENSMELNDTKFQLLQHGKAPQLEQLKKPYSVSPGVEVVCDGSVRDLGVIVDPGLTWKPHITEIVKRATTMASWVLRVFRTRNSEHLLTLYKTYVRSHLEYCSPAWSPYLVGEISRIEAVQRSFTAKISGMENQDYWDRLKSLRIYSLQRRRERYKILYMWKIANNLVPNPFGITFRHSPRHGLQAERWIGKAKLASVNTIIHNSFTSSAVGLFNAAPPIVKEQPTIEKAKAELDRFLSTIPDEPPTRNYTTSNNNSLLDWLRQGAVKRPIA